MVLFRSVVKHFLGILGELIKRIFRVLDGNASRQGYMAAANESPEVLSDFAG